MDKSITIEVPVLVIGFNRPGILRQCVFKLRESRPTNMYFTCDGAREGRDGEELLVSEVRSIMENEIDWPCEKRYRYNEHNKGCEVTESEAITWVLGENEYVIVIEDDIIAPYSFLRFAQEMLYRYRNEERVYQITSDNVTPMPFPNDEDYCFSIYGHIWGWATWKRAWEHFDLYVNDFKETLRSADSRSDLTPNERRRLKTFCRRLMREERKHAKMQPKHTWDLVWSYIKWRDGGLTVVPRVHLSSNVGVEGLHSRGRTESHFRSFEEDFEAARHPAVIERCLAYDQFHYDRYLKQPPYFVRQWGRLVGYIKRRLLRKR